LKVMVLLNIGNVYSVFTTLKIIQSCLTQQNDNRSFRVHSNIWANTILYV
jgi:hypothetical protein